MIQLGCIALWACAMVATHLPPRRLPHLGVGLGTSLHALGYFVLVGALWLTLDLHGQSRRRRLAIILLAVPLYAAIEEISQPLFGRCASLIDWSVDVLGTVTAVAVFEIVKAIRGRDNSGSRAAA
ncbi:MAG: hypothetical protein B1H04_03205 [Planctomycetales bacterium 4484_123]|nr:MAG: hypothetical protein B1H04_03205 [Planctomycetales bacterium 4484_123]